MTFAENINRICAEKAPLDEGANHVLALFIQEGRYKGR